MAKSRIVYACQSCGYQSPKWLGKCPDCNQWNSLVEEKQERVSHPRGELSFGSKEDPSPIHEINTEAEGRALTGIGEFDRVLGGGLVAGSVILIGGDPGIGKSTLLLQAFAAISQQGLTCLYVSGEESQRQIKMRAERLDIAAPNLLILSETSLERILDQVKRTKPAVLVIDSIQTIFTSSLPSAPGSIAQVRESSGSIIVLAKKTGLTTFLIGHVTKDGAIAGPRVLEHMVDTVLYFEGDRGHSFRILRAVKNRFGSTNEIGVFEMKEAGLKEVSNPSEIFLMERPLQVPGSAVDLGIIAAVASSHKERVLDPKTVFFGEVGLAGEIRGISQAEARVKEAGKLGFERCILPASNISQLTHVKHPQLTGVNSPAECWKLLF